MSLWTAEEAAAALSDAQRTRLTSVLTRIYGHPVSVQLHVDPSLLGGLTITVGDEDGVTRVIDSLGRFMADRRGA